MKTFAEFFGFKEDPFKRTPDVDFYHPTKMHEEALDTLNYMLESDEAFAVIIGEPGTGKTMTIRKFISELSPNIVTAYILFPSLTPEELFLAILEDFNVKPDADLSKNALFSKFRDFLINIKEQGKTAVIIIDEAQNLPSNTLEELRILSNLETEKEKLLKIVLAGQPELSNKLDSDGLRQLKQRITLYSYLSNIDEQDIKNYINSHLAKAGRSSIRVQSNVIRKIARITKGNPRLINTLMERAIIAAFLDNSYTVTDDHLSSAISSVNTIMSTIRRRRSMRYVKAGVIGILAGGCFAAGFFVFALWNEGASLSFAPQVEVAQIEPKPTIGESAPKVREKELAPIESATVEKDTIDNGLGREDRQSEQVPEVAQVDVIDTPPIEENMSPLIPGLDNPIPSTPVDMLPIPPSEEAVAEADISIGTLVTITASTLNVRAEPSLQAGRIDSVGRGQEFIVLDNNEFWVKIRITDNKAGWIYKKYIKIID